MGLLWCKWMLRLFWGCFGLSWLLLVFVGKCVLVVGEGRSLVFLVFIVGCFVFVFCFYFVCWEFVCVCVVWSFCVIGV